MPIRMRRCTCGREYEVLDLGGKLSALDRDDIDDLSCPTCGGVEFEGLVSLGSGIDLGDVGGVGKVYPYFDQGLQRHINSAAHRKQVCAELGVRPLEGSFRDQMERSVNAQDTAARRQEAAFREQEARNDADPDVRRAKAQMAKMMEGLKDPRELRDRLRRA